MQGLDPYAFWLVLGTTFGVIALYALYRMTQRAIVNVNDTESYINVLPTSSTVAIEAAGEWVEENAEATREDGLT
jgi:hypothetical protein